MLDRIGAKRVVDRMFLAHLLPVKLLGRWGDHGTTLATTSRWFVGVEINPTADFFLWNLSMDTLGDIKEIYRRKGHEIR